MSTLARGSGWEGRGLDAGLGGWVGGWVGGWIEDEPSGVGGKKGGLAAGQGSCSCQQCSRRPSRSGCCWSSWVTGWVVWGGREKDC